MKKGFTQRRGEEREAQRGRAGPKALFHSNPAFCQIVRSNSGFAASTTSLRLYFFSAPLRELL